MEGVGLTAGDISVNGRRLRAIVSRRPSPAPTVVLEAGLGATADFWAWVQPSLAAAASTVSYDRAGVGGSGEAPALPSQALVDRALDDLGAVIAGREPRSPLILVGHSSGALLVQLFAAAHPDAVAALVLIDPTPADIRVLPLWMRCAFGPAAAATRGLAWLADRGAFRGSNPFAREVATLPPAAAANVAAALIKGSHLRAMAAELGALAALQARALELEGRLAQPTLVISAGLWTKRGALGRTILAAHKSLAHAAPLNRVVSIDGADHMTLVTDRAHADACTAQIRRFLQDLADGPEVGSQETGMTG